MRRTVFLLAVVLTAPVAPPPAVDAAETRVPRFEAAVALVRVTAVVRDRSGAPVRGLTPADFRVTEDGKPQAIESFGFEDLPLERAPDASDAAPPVPPLLRQAFSPATPRSSDQGPGDLAGRRLVVLLFDTNGLDPEQIERGVTSARDYVEKRMTAADAVAVAAIGKSLQILHDFTNDRAALLRALAGLSGDAIETGVPAEAVTGDDAANDGEAFGVDSSELDLFNIDRRLRAIEDLSKALRHVVQKKSIVYFSGGVAGVGADNQIELRAAIDHAVKANVSVYPVDVRGLEAVVPGGEAREASSAVVDAFSGRAVRRQFDNQLASQDTLASLASDTGGRAFLDDNDLRSVYERVVQDSSAYYVLGYASTNPAKNGRFRRVRIEVVRTGLRVEHRSGYYAERDFRHAGRDDRERQLQDQLLTDLSSTDFPVWVQSAHFRTGEDRYYVAVSVAVPGSALPLTRSGAKERITLELAGVVRDEAMRSVARLRDTVDVAGTDVRRKNVQYRTGFTLSPGRYRLKVVVREDEEGAFGSFETEVTVPDLRRSPVKMSSVVFGTQLAPAVRLHPPSPLARDGMELAPSVTHVVSSGQPVYFYYEVYEPARGPKGDVRVLTSIAFYRGRVRRHETPLVSVERLAAPGRKAAVLELAVPAASLEPGLYTCQVNVIDDVAGTFAFPRLALLVREDGRASRP